MARKLHLTLAASALTLALASTPAHAGTGELRPAGSQGFLSGLWSRLVAVFTPYETRDVFDQQDGEDPDNREGGSQGRGYIDPNGNDAGDA